MDADCRADPGWVRHLVAAFRSRPDIAVVSGRTFYDGTGLGERVLCLLSRSYLDPGRAGETAFASNNAWDSAEMSISRIRSPKRQVRSPPESSPNIPAGVPVLLAAHNIEHELYRSKIARLLERWPVLARPLERDWRSRDFEWTSMRRVDGAIFLSELDRAASTEECRR